MAFTVKKLNIFYKKSPVIQHAYKKGKYTRKDIQTLAQKYSNDLHQKGFRGKVSVALKYPEGWRSGYFAQTGQPVILYTHHDSDIEYWEEPEHFETFVVYTSKDATARGGVSAFEQNDCLYNCLIEVHPNIKKVFPEPKSLKSFLELEGNDKVDIARIPEIEDKLKDYKINVIGDHIYTSTKVCNMEIPLKLVGGHYSVDHSGTWKPHSFSHRPRKPIIFTRKIGQILAYDGKRERIMPHDVYDKIKSRPRSSPFVLIPGETNDPKDDYENFIKMANCIKKATDGKIDMYKTGSIPVTALKFFHDTSVAIQPEPIRQDEAFWIMKATMAGIIWAKPYTGPGYKYDVCSHYPAIMNQQQFVVPIKRGDFRNMTKKQFDDMPNIWPGIYRCVVEGQSKAFRLNKFDYYTHYDLKTAQELGFKITLIIDNEPNALIYDNTRRISGNKIFGEYINTIFALKQQGIVGAKKLLNTLWGVLGKKSLLNFNYKNGHELIIKDENSLISIVPVPIADALAHLPIPDNGPHSWDGNHLVSVAKNDGFYESNYARMMPFLLAKGRRDIFTIMQPHLHLVKRIHTDGFITTKDIKVKLGTKMGDLKYEGSYPEVQVHNSMKVTGKFINAV